MKTITKLIAIIMTLATLVAVLPGGGGLLPVVNAQTGDGSVRFVSYASIGIVRGQRIRLSVANTAESGGSLTLSFSYYLAHGSNSSSSVPLYESEWIKVPPKEFRFSDVSREDLNTEGEPETGRSQLLVKVTFIAPAGSNADDFPGALEIFQDEVRDGGSVNTISKYRLILVAANSSKQLNAPIGFIPGETLRYSVFYPNEESDQPVRVQAYIYDSYGNLLKQSDPVVLRPGESYAFDFNGDDPRLPAARNAMAVVQLSAGVPAASIDGSVRPVKLSVSMEVVNNRTGSTSRGSYYTGTLTVSGEG